MKRAGAKFTAHGKTARNVHAETPHSLRRRLTRILTKLRQTRPDALVELKHETPLELLIATILSAQCTDQRVNQVTPILFHRYPTAASYAKADPNELQDLIRPTGFFRAKTRSVMACAQALLERFGGQVPDDMEALVSLPGVGRKTANVVLGNCFGKPAVIVDTHVKRVAYRLGLTAATDPDKVEEDLRRVMGPNEWTGGSQRLLLHGRYVCVARRPKCEQCVVYSECPWEGKWPKPSRA